MPNDASTDDILGQEFLTWLWFSSDSQASFTAADGEQFSVSMEQRIVVQGGSGESRETASVSGAFSPLGEARYGLATGKKVTRALLRLEKADMAFQLVLKAEDLSFGSLRTPKVEKDGDSGDEDPDALFLEKIYLMEVCVGLIDSLYQTFLDIRFSDEWDATVRAIHDWFTAPRDEPLRS